MKRKNVLTFVQPVAVTSGDELITKTAALPITAVYEGLSVMIAAAIAHPHVCGPVEMYLCEFADKIGARAEGRRAAADPPHLTPEFILENLPGLLIAAHNKVANEEGLPVAA